MEENFEQLKVNTTQKAFTVCMNDEVNIDDELSAAILNYNMSTWEELDEIPVFTIK